MNLNGDIAETRVESRQEALSLTVAWLILTINAFFIIMAPIILLDVWLDFLPLWFSKLMVFIWFPAVLLHIAFFTLTRRGRRIFRSILSTIIHDHPIRLLSLTRNAATERDDDE